MMTRALLALVIVALTAAHGAAQEHSQPGVPTLTALTPAASEGNLSLALAALAAGDVAPLRSIAPAQFSEPWGIVDRDDVLLVRIWTAHLPGLIARLDDATRVVAGMALDDAWRRADLSRQNDEQDLTDERVALAACFLPAPLAQDVLRRARDLAFDRGRLPQMLALDAVLGQCREPTTDEVQRHAVAARLSGLRPFAAALPLSAPGIPQPLVSPPAVVAEIPRLIWRADLRLLLARDPWGRVLWQRRLSESGNVQCGSAGAVTLTDDGHVLVRADGTALSLDLPSAAHLLGLTNEAAWFAVGTRATRIALGDGARSDIALPVEPLTPPLEGDGATLWLAARELMLVRGATLTERLRHGLDVTPGWRLEAAEGEPLLIAPTQQTFRIPSWSQQAEATPSQRLVMLARACRWRECVDLATQQPALLRDDAARRATLAAHLALGFPQAEVGRVLALARDADEQAQVHYRAWSSAPQAVPNALLLALRQRPALLLPREPADFAEAEADWRQAVSASALTQWLTAPPKAWPMTGDDLRPLQETPPMAAVPPAPDEVVITQGMDFTALTAHARDGSVRWRQRWSAGPLPSGAPNRSFARRDGMLVISEGVSRLVVVDPTLGDLMGSVTLTRLDAEPVQVAVLRADHGVVRLGVLHPVALNTHLTLIGSDGRELTRTLPTPARWVIRAPGHHALVALVDGSALLVPGDGSPWHVVELTAGIANASVVSANADGVQGDGVQAGWRPASPRP